MHGYGISRRLAALSHDQFQVNPGSFFPSLYRLGQDGKLKAEWRVTENNRRPLRVVSSSRGSDRRSNRSLRGAGAAGEASAR
jgi:PadR family transcriptional regulator PadR